MSIRFASPGMGRRASVMRGSGRGWVPARAAEPAVQQEKLAESARDYLQAGARLLARGSRQMVDVHFADSCAAARQIRHQLRRYHRAPRLQVDSFEQVALEELQSAIYVANPDAQQEAH